MNRKNFLITILLFFFFWSMAKAQLDYQLRLEPVWSRVADVLGEAGSIESAEFSPDGRFIVSGSKYDFSVIMWRTSDGHELWRQYAEQEIERVGWSSDGKYVASCSEDQLVTIYDGSNGDVVKTLVHDAGIDGLTWAHESNTLVTGEEYIDQADGTREGWVNFFSMPAGDLIRRVNFGSTVNELFFSSDDKYLLAAGHQATKIYDASTGELLKTLRPERDFKFVTAHFSPDAKYVIGGGEKGTMFLWDWKSGEMLREFNHTGKKIETVSWHPNGRYIALTGHEPYIRIYRVQDLIKYESERIPVAAKIWSGDHAEYIDFNRDGSFLVSAHQNGLIKLWAWMGEDPDLNDLRHRKISQEQREYNSSRGKRK